MPRTKKVSIYVVAEAAGVSSATVSKVLNNAHDVSDEVRERVQAEIKRCGYVPREQQGRTTVLCVIVQQLPGHRLDFGTYIAATLEGISAYCRREGIELSIMADERDELNRREVLRDLRRRRANAALVLRGDERSDWIDTVAESMPTLALHLPRPAAVELVRCDEEALGQLAAEHLHQRGCRRIALLAAPPGNAAAERRLAGFQRAWIAAGGDAQDLVQRWSDPHHDARSFGSEGAQQVVAGANPVDGIFASDYGVAQGVLHGLWFSGYRAGADVAVVSCDEYPEAAWSTPPLSTVGWSNAEVGAQAAGQLHRLLRGERPEPIEVTLRLTPRQSSQRPS